MATGSASIHVDAQPEVVYDLVSDITRMGEWSPETYRTAWRGSATRAVPGARFRGWNRIGWLRWFTDPVIDVADRGRELAFTTTFLGRGRFSRWRYTFRPAEGGGTEVTESWESLLPGLRRVERGRRVDMLNRGMEATLARIKAAAEAQS